MKIVMGFENADPALRRMSIHDLHSLDVARGGHDRLAVKGAARRAREAV
jgi:hypothetical protein